MNAWARWLCRSALLVVVALFTLRSGHWVTGAVMAALVLGSGFARQGLAINRAGQLLLLLFGMVLAWPLFLALRGDGDGQTLGSLGTVIALVCLLVALPRLFIAAPRLGEPGTAALSMLALLGCAHLRSGRDYPLFLALFVVLQLAALRAADPARPRLRALSGRHRGAMALMLVIIVGAGVGLALAIPPAHSWAMRRFYFSFARARSGFSSELQLGSLSDMYQSDKLVLRVFTPGPRPDHLRGYVYSRYARGGEWTAGQRMTSLAATLPEAVPGAQDLTRIVTVSGNSRSYFLPLKARAVRTRGGLARVSPAGIVRAPPGEPAEEVQFRAGPRDRFGPSPPAAEDLAVPARIAPRLRQLVRRWTPKESHPGVKLAALQRKLRHDFTYSLSFTRRPGQDPVMDFLTRDPQGHCEYFASAMALLARSAGIPARVVGGYVVQERNPLTGHYVVRERHAHAWVEAWTRGDGWQTFDPTPRAGLAAASQSEMSMVTALGDLVGARLAAAWRWVTDLTALHVSAAVGALLLVWTLLLLLRRRRADRAHGPCGQAYRAPLPGLERLLEAVSRRGPNRRPAEPLERYAMRLSRDPSMGNRGASVASLLQRYAAWRFGLEGDAEQLARELETQREALEGQ